MAINISTNFSAPRSNDDSVEQAHASPSLSSSNSEPALFNNHTIAPTDTSNKRKFSDTDLLFTAIDTPPDLKGRKITPISDEYTWDPEEEGKLHSEITDDDDLNHAGTSFPEELEHEALHEENLFQNFEVDDEDDALVFSNHQISPSSPAAVQERQKATPKEELSGATLAILKALNENNSLSHQEAMQVARTTLTNEGAKQRTLEEKAFKSVAQVFNKLLHKTSSTVSPDAHLKNQDRFYSDDFQQGLNAGLSKQDAYKDAILRAGQRSFYFNPKQNVQESKNQARTGLQAARDYFIRQKSASSESLPTIDELFPEVMTTGIMTTKIEKASS